MHRCGHLRANNNNNGWTNRNTNKDNKVDLLLLTMITSVRSKNNSFKNNNLKADNNMLAQWSGWLISLAWWEHSSSWIKYKFTIVTLLWKEIAVTLTLMLPSPLCFILPYFPPPPYLLLSTMPVSMVNYTLLPVSIQCFHRLVNNVFACLCKQYCYNRWFCWHQQTTISNWVNNAATTSQ